MHNAYPIHPIHERTLTLADFPTRIATWSPSSVYYLRSHHISPDPALKMTSVYPTVRGICFVLTPVLCFQERITARDTMLRFYNPVGSPIGKAVFVPAPIPDDARVVFLVEGVTDALAVHQSGAAVISVVGANVTTEQLHLVNHMTHGRRVIMLPDNDGAGAECVATLVRELSVRVQYLPPQWKDVCDLPTDYRTELLRKAGAK